MGGSLCEVNCCNFCLYKLNNNNDNYKNVYLFANFFCHLLADLLVDSLVFVLAPLPLRRLTLFDFCGVTEFIAERNKIWLTDEYACDYYRL